MIRFLKNKKGFSLVEMIVVIAVIALVLPAVFGIVFSILKQEVTVYELSEVKRQGDGALSTIQNALRPVTKAYIDPDSEVCGPGSASFPADYPRSGYTDGNDLYFQDNAGSTFQIKLNPATSQIIFGTAAGSPLTTSKVKITSFEVKCERAASYAPAVITLHFTIQYNTTQISNTALTYRTKIVLRNY